MQEDPKNTALEAFLGKVMVQATKAAETATDAVNDYVNSGWQVKKRAGQVLPEIRPNAADIGERAALIGARGGENGAIDPEMRSAGSGSAIEVAASPGGLSTETDTQLQTDFVSFLATKEPGTFREGRDGSITFESREALAGVVASFTFTKLREMAAAAKALARYVDDLESELEASDDLVVEARKEMYTSQKKQKDAEQALQMLQQEQETTRKMLQEAEAQSQAQLNARKLAEKEAEAAAERLLEAQATLQETLSAEKEAAAAAAREAEAAAQRAVDEASARLEKISSNSSEMVAQAQAQAQAEAQAAVAASAREKAAVQAEAEAQAAAQKAELVRLEERLMAAETKRPALSSMKKAQLQAECDERGLESAGTVAELRAALRLERKRDKLVEQLQERGWSEKQARGALDKSNWVLEDAIQRLLE